MRTPRKLRQRLSEYWLYQRTADLARQVADALSENNSRIPVIVISYNNAIYVENMVRQLAEFHIHPIIIDNASSYDTQKGLLDIERSGAAKIVYSRRNWGHKVGFLAPIYERLPPVFAYTDPDLQLNASLPKNFLEVLESLTERYRIYKAGFALDLLENQPIVDFAHPRYGDVRSWEAQYWCRQLVHEKLEIWAADIDTTFAVYNKKYYDGRFFDGVRVGREFAAIHLPWFPNLDLLSDEQRATYAGGNKSSTWVKR